MVCWRFLKQLPEARFSQASMQEVRRPGIRFVAPAEL
ncbi:MAG: hypothetical protein ACI8UO_006565, partial [Verrucomicrobiales bacterium]